MKGGSKMAAGDKYRAKALEFLARAQSAKDAQTRAKLDGLAAAYNRLAMQADRNEGLVIDFNLPPQDAKKPKQ